MSDFIRSTSDDQPKLVRYSAVPESAKHPAGPYRQAPAEFGGEWWFVNPFTSKTPWDKLSPVVDDTNPDFLRVFGQRPSRSDDRFKKLPDQVLKTLQEAWDKERAGFQDLGIPVLAPNDGEKLDAAEAIFAFFGMGKPQYFNGRYGWRATFPEAALPNWACGFSAAIDYPGVTVAGYQIDALAAGLKLERPHPFVPPFLLGE